MAGSGADRPPATVTSEEFARGGAASPGGSPLRVRRLTGRDRIVVALMVRCRPCS
jgi:hypothetical protein